MQMGRLFAFVQTLLVAFSLAAVPTDYYIMFETAGEDCYADGTPLVEGERYALVWRCNDLANQVDGLFNADGSSPYGDDKCEVLFLFDAAERKTAADGHVYARAKKSFVQMNAQHLMDRFWTGVYSIFVFDTRVYKDGQLTLSERINNWTPAVLNGYGVVTDLAAFDTYEKTKASEVGFFAWNTPSGRKDFTNETKYVSSGDVTVARSDTSSVSVLAVDLPTPAFSAISADGATVTVSATNGSPYVAYGLSRVERLAELNTKTNIVAVEQGRGAASMTWHVPVGTATNGFFRIFPLR